jgi:acetylornithine/N-succinyldiaminopimelate aminotransferase
VCCFEYGDQGGTFCGNPIMAAVGVAVMEEITKSGFLAQVTGVGEHLAEGLRALARRHGCGAVRGKGLLRALDLQRDVGAEIVEASRARGLLLNAPRPDSLRFMPALTVSEAEVDQMLGILAGVMAGVWGRKAA